MEPVRDAPSLGELWLTFARFGATAFGGGSTALILIRRAVVDERRWMEDGAFTRDWSLCQATPGINLLGMTLLVGWRLRGLGGAVAALLGFLLPSVLITVGLTAAYESFRENPHVAAALRGIVPATVGLGLLTAFQMARPLLKQGGREGNASLALSVLIIAGSVGMSVARLPVPMILIGAAGIGALAHWRLPLRRADRSEGAD